MTADRDVKAGSATAAAIVAPGARAGSGTEIAVAIVGPGRAADSATAAAIVDRGAREASGTGTAVPSARSRSGRRVTGQPATGRTAASAATEAATVALPIGATGDHARTTAVRAVKAASVIAVIAVIAAPAWIARRRAQARAKARRPRIGRSAPAAIAGSAAVTVASATDAKAAPGRTAVRGPIRVVVAASGVRAVVAIDRAATVAAPAVAGRWVRADPRGEVGRT